MADKTPKELIGILFVVMIFIFGYAGFYSSVMGQYSANYTELSSVNKTQEIFGTIEEQFNMVNDSMIQNPKSDDVNIFVEGGTLLWESGVTMGYMFLSIPGWFQSIFYDLANNIGIIPTWLLAIALFFIMIEIISWLIYFWTNRRS